MAADGVRVVRADARRLVDQFVCGLECGERPWLIAAEGVSLGLANQAQSAVAIGECHDGLGGPGETCGLGAVETVGGLLRLVHEDVGGHPFVARSAPPVRGPGQASASRRWRPRGCRQSMTQTPPIAPAPQGDPSIASCR